MTALVTSMMTPLPLLLTYINVTVDAQDCVCTVEPRHRTLNFD